MPSREEQLQLDITPGVDLSQLEGVLREGINDAATAGIVDQAAPKAVSVEQGAQGISPDPVTATIIIFGPLTVHILRDIWDRYIRPRLDVRFGPNSVRPRH
jgi:hypothetical protein